MSILTLMDIISYALQKNRCSSLTNLTGFREVIILSLFPFLFRFPSQHGGGGSVKVLIPPPAGGKQDVQVLYVKLWLVYPENS